MAEDAPGDEDEVLEPRDCAGNRERKGSCDWGVTFCWIQEH